MQVPRPSFPRRVTPNLMSVRLRTGLVWLLAAMIVVVAGVANAELAPREEMDNVGRNWLAQITHDMGRWGGSDQPKLATPIDLVVDGDVLGVVYQVEPTGYIVVSGWKELAPVMLYSDESQLDLDAPEGMGALIREVLQNRAENFIARYGSLDAVVTGQQEAVHRGEWDRYRIDPKQFADQLANDKLLGTEDMGPLLTTSWHQGYPYNNLCPIGDGGRTVVGCVATAAAQIMAYWQWPDAGEGSESYWWGGDNSCGGVTSGQTLTADFSDTYDWANIVDDCHSGCNSAEQAALAELCYEVGVAFNMDYGACGSGAYTSYAQTVFPTYFRYSSSTIDRENRDDHSAESYFAIIQTEINDGRPIQYRISGHSIVCDGWRLNGSIMQVHMNYGWDDGHNAWYTLDQLHCTWSGCSPLVEYAVVGIMPFNACSIASTKVVDEVPFIVAFEATSDLDVETWYWDFGDGGDAFVQNPIYEYTTPGVYDVVLTVTVGGDQYQSTRNDFVVALADTLRGTEQIEGEAGQVVEFVVSGRNTCDLHTIKVPIEITGDLSLSFSDMSVTGCRTEFWGTPSFQHWDEGNGRYTLKLEADGAGNLPPGEGDLLKVMFTVSGSAQPGQVANLSLAGYDDYDPQFVSPVALCVPVTHGGAVTTGGCCIGMRGNFDNDASDAINIVDVTEMVAYLFASGDSPECWEEGNVDGDAEEKVNVVDLTMLVSYLFSGGQEPAPCY